MVGNKMDSKMYVLKRDGRKEPVLFDKITSRIQKLCYNLNMDFIDPPSVTLKVISGLYTGVETTELDNLTAKTAAKLGNEHPDYAVLAARIEVSNLHKQTKKLFSNLTEDLYENALVSEEYHNIVHENSDRLNSAIIYDRDFSYSYFGFKVLESTYLMKIQGKVVERPQQMLMRISVSIHKHDIESAIETYNLLSERWYMHSPQTMKEAGVIDCQLFSGYSLSILGDSIDGIYDTLESFSSICRFGGKVGLNVHSIRATGSYISGTNGTSNGLVPMLRVYNSIARFTNQGNKKEIANLTIYLEPWHSDIFEFLFLKKKEGKDESRANDLSYALWIPDLFMKRIDEDGDWCLMCPHKCSKLFSTSGEEFEQLYKTYENEGLYNRKVKARELWYIILQSQIETGEPAMMYKDNCNNKSNQKNLGVVRNSNYSGEMMGFSSEKEMFSCGSAIVSLEMYVNPDKTFNFTKLKEVVKKMTVNLDKLIDVSCFPDEDAKEGSLKNRPIAIGVQGLADVFIKMRLPYVSNEAKKLNKEIFEAIYFAALESSCELARKLGPYEHYEDSPISKGIFQFDMWKVVPSDMNDWSQLKSKIATHGVRNSLLVALSPTPSTARIQGCSEGIGPITSNIQQGKVSLEGLSMINPHLLTHLADLDLWDDDVWQNILDNKGSVQNVVGLPEDLKDVFKTVWEMPQKTILEMTADRGAFIDQSQSVNVHMSFPNFGKLTSMHFYAWNIGLKTGMHRLNVKDGNQQKQKEATVVEIEEKRKQEMTCSIDNKEECLMCGS